MNNDILYLCYICITYMSLPTTWKINLCQFWSFYKRAKDEIVLIILYEILLYLSTYINLENCLVCIVFISTHSIIIFRLKIIT